MTALRDEMERSGTWLFRWRSYLPLIALVVALLGLARFDYPGGSHALDRIWEFSCFALSLLGLGVRIATVGHAPRGTSGRNTREGQVAEVLNTTGMYSIVRHPLYLGNYLMWLGVTLLPRAWWVPVLISLGFWLYYERIMFAEEEYLRRRFGEEFRIWSARTPAFLPDFRFWRSPALPFSLRTVLGREYSGFFGLVSVFTLFEVAGDFVAAGTLRLDSIWVGLFAGSLLAYCALLWLKRRTSLLRVPGR
jgi:protein-S-isoprenylcysteine O-methyltransferase Ste14